MTTTTATVAQSSYAVGLRHVHIDVRSSSPTTGGVYKGIGEFRIYRGGSLVKSANNVHEFAWLAAHGDEWYARYTDFTGDKGAWETGTISVTGAYAIQYYVRNSGNNANPGTSGSPFATVDHAVTQMRANLTSGQVGVIWLMEGETHTSTGSLCAGSGTARCFHFRRWGNTTTRPIVNGTTGFATGMRESFAVEGVDLVINNASGTAFYLFRFGGDASGRAAYNSWVKDCAVTGSYQNLVYVDDTGSTVSGADRAVCSWFALDNVTSAASSQRALYGYTFPQYWLIDGWDFDAPAGSANLEAPIRSGRFARCFFRGIRCTASSTSGRDSFRFIQGDASGEGAFHSCSFLDCEFYTGGAATQFRIDAAQADGQANAYVNNLTFSNCTWEAWGLGADGFAFQAHTTGTQVIQEIAFRNCYGVREINFGAGAATSYDEILLVHCYGERDDANQGTPLVRCDSTAGAFADGCFELYGCVAYYPTAGTSGTRSIVEAPTAAKVGVIQYCHIGKVDNPGGTQGIINGSAASGTNTSDVSTTYNLTAHSTTFAALNPRLTSVSSGGTQLAGTGWPHSYSIDADNKVRDASTPDAGPFEFGATTEPDNPVGGGAIAALAAVNRMMQGFQ